MHGSTSWAVDIVAHGMGDSWLVLYIECWYESFFTDNMDENSWISWKFMKKYEKSWTLMQSIEMLIILTHDYYRQKRLEYNEILKFRIRIVKYQQNCLLFVANVNLFLPIHIKRHTEDEVGQVNYWNLFYL